MLWKHILQNAQIPTICHQNKTLKYISSHKICTVCTVYKSPLKANLVLTAAESLGTAEASVVGNVPYRAPLCRVCEHLPIPLCRARAGWLRGNDADWDYGQEACISVGPHTVQRGQQPFIPPLQSFAQHVIVHPTEQGYESCFCPSSKCMHVTPHPNLCTLQYQKKKFKKPHPLQIDLFGVICVEIKSICDFRKWWNKLMGDNTKGRLE